MTIRTRIWEVRAAAAAALAVATVGVPALLVLLGPDDRARPPHPTGAGTASTGAVPLPAPVLSPPSARSAEEVRVDSLTERHDVDGLVETLRQLRTAGGAGEARLRVQALAAIGRVPGERSAQILGGIAGDPALDGLERASAVAALWERGDHAAVEALAVESNDPVVRSKARVLMGRR